MTAASKGKRVYALTLPFIVVAFVLDRLTKWWAVERLQPDTIELISGWLDFTYVPNYNIVFFLNFPVWVMLLIVGIVTMALIAVATTEFQQDRHASVAAIMLMLAGALSNALDRIQIGAVIDFIRIPFWSIFNIADIMVLVGAVLVVVVSNRSAKREKAL